MKPVAVSIDVPQGPERVYEHIDVLANHEPFTDHMLVDWECSGPRSGVGARARMRFKRRGPPDWIEMEVIEAEPPRLPDGGTRINFRFEWIETPLGDRLLAPVVRTILRRGDERAMRRLAAELERG
jgi:hypothetical protein